LSATKCDLNLLVKTQCEVSRRFARFLKQVSDFAQVGYEGFHLLAAGFMIGGS